MNVRAIACFLIISIVFFLLLRNPIADLLELLGDQLSGFTSFKDRLPEISQFLRTLTIVKDRDSDFYVRSNLYFQSIEGFIKSPLLGQCFINNSKTCGGHSFVFDTLCEFGLLGLFLIILFFGPIFGTMFLSNPKDKAVKSAIFLLIIFYFLYGCINTAFGPVQLLFLYLLPFGCLSILKLNHAPQNDKTNTFYLKRKILPNL